MKKKLRRVWMLMAACMLIAILPAYALAEAKIGNIDVSQGNVKLYANHYQVGSKTFPYDVQGQGVSLNTHGQTANTVTVTKGLAVHITLNGVDIKSGNSVSAFALEDKTNVMLTLREGTINRLESGDNCAGLQVPATATLAIDGTTGILNSKGGTYGAGIGGGNSNRGGTVNIRGGVIVAAGGRMAAGIGGGRYGSGGTETISGGTVTASSGDDGAGIGGGALDQVEKKENPYPSGGMVTISGGTVTASSRDDGAGIGGGKFGTGGTIIITGGRVTANSHYGVGIGSGATHYVSGGAIRLEGDCYVTVPSCDAQLTLSRGIWNQNGDVTFGGTVTLPKDLTELTAGKTGTVKPGTNLTIPSEHPFTVKGTLQNKGIITNKGTLSVDPTCQSENPIFVYGKLKNDGMLENKGVVNVLGILRNDGTIRNGGTVNGTISGNLPQGHPAVIRTGESSLSVDQGDIILYNDHYLVGEASFDYDVAEKGVTLTGSTLTHTVTAAKNQNVKVTLDNADIQCKNDAAVPFDLQAGATASLTLQGNANKLEGGTLGTSVRIPGTASVAIRGSGRLDVTGHFDRRDISGGGTVSIDGGASLTASSEDASVIVNQGILFLDGNLTVGGQVTLPKTLTEIGTGKTGTVEPGATLTISPGQTLTVKGEFDNYGKINGEDQMVQSGGGVLHTYDTSKQGNVSIDLSAITGDLTLYSDHYFIGKEYCVVDPQTAKKGLVLTGETKTHTVTVAPKQTVQVTLNGAAIQDSEDNRCAFSLQNGAAVTLTLAEGTSNVLQSGSFCAGLQAPDSTRLTVQGLGALNATGGFCGAGIGGGDGRSCGEINITGGRITAHSQNLGSSLGGGYNGNGGNITITGGSVKVGRGGVGASNIGGGELGLGGTLKVDGQTVVDAYSCNDVITLIHGVIGANSKVLVAGDVTMTEDMASLQGNWYVLPGAKLTIPPRLHFYGYDKLTVQPGGSITPQRAQ